MVIYTIGHSNHKKERFLELLKGAGIEMVIDVRALPRSRWVPWSTRGVIEGHLQAEGIKYRWLGDKLGGNPALLKERGYRITAEDFKGWDKRESYREGISILMEEAQKQRVAIMCAEEDPARCHRQLLIGESLRKSGVEVIHIRAKS